jgi:NADH-quinone oxidoreductase subunit M
VKLPVYAGLLSFMAFASLGLPLLAGFISEFFIFRGSLSIYPIITGIASIGIVINAAYLLWMLQRVLLGPLNPRWAELPDMNNREIVSLAPLVLLTVVVGVLPVLLTGVFNNTIMNIIRAVAAIGG